ncbi:hypothetical protein AB0436_18855 [Streptomyces sp. NPDC051322]|uniref:hypothetical protein n=1 Tax=Streptomyces sp. NPDC051322 TaxID=3154645 RepID=UPI00344BD0FA
MRAAQMGEDKVRLPLSPPVAPASASRLQTVRYDEVEAVLTHPVEEPGRGLRRHGRRRAGPDGGRHRRLRRIRPTDGYYTVHTDYSSTGAGTLALDGATAVAAGNAGAHRG